MSKRTSSKMRVNVNRSCRVCESLRTKKNGQREAKAVTDDGITVTDPNIKGTESVPDTSEISLTHREYNHRNDVLTLLVPDVGCIRKRAAPFLAAHAKRKIRKKDGIIEFALNAIPKGTRPPLGCRLVLGIVAPEGTGTDQHIKETRGGHAQRRDYSAKKGPKRTYRLDGRPNGEEVGRPIQGDTELTPLNNREAAQQYWH